MTHCIIQNRNDLNCLQIWQGMTRDNESIYIYLQEDIDAVLSHANMRRMDRNDLENGWPVCVGIDDFCVAAIF